MRTKKAATQMGCSFLQRLYCCLRSARRYLYSALLRTVTASPRHSSNKLDSALGSSLLDFFKVGVLYVVASVLRRSTALGTRIKVRTCLCTALSSVSCVVHILASRVESIV